MNAANTLIATLRTAGIDKIFSISGNQIMSVYDASIGSSVEIIHTRHEAGAVFMADGYARTSGRIGVVLATAAPGFANALAPLYAVRYAETPLLLLSGDSPTTHDGMGAFQELNQPAIAAGLTKESWRCVDAGRLAEEVAGAIRLAASGRPGPVHMALPKDILGHDSTPLDEDTTFQPEPMPLGTADLHAIMAHLDKAEAPLIITGASLAAPRRPGVAATLQENLGIPVIAMQSSRGLNDPALGRIRGVLKAADLILLIDKDIDFTLGFAATEHVPAAKFITIAAEAESITRANNLVSGRLVWGCLADPLTTCETLGGGRLTTNHGTWLKKVEKALAERPAGVYAANPSPAKAKSKGAFSSATFAAVLAAHIANLPTPPIVIADGGEIGQWAQAALPIAHMHTNGASGSIGGSIPQAIGAAFANPGRRIIAVMGDGTAGFHFMEIEIARRWSLPITFIIGNDRRWGAEVEIQKKRYGPGRLIGCMLDDKTRYDMLARGLGAKGVLVEDAHQFTAALNKAARAQTPVVIDARIDGLPAPVFKSLPRRK